MAQNDNQEPIIESDSIHEEEVIITEKPKRKRSKVMLIGGLFLVGAVAYSFMSANDTPTTSTVVPPPVLDTTVSGEIQQTSPEYLESLRNANDANRQAAIEQGRTFIPSPEGALTPIEDTTETLPETTVEAPPPAEDPEPEAVVTRKRPVVPQLRRTNETAQTSAQPAAQQGQQQEEPPNPYIELMNGRMAALSGAYVPKPSMTEHFSVSEPESQQEPATATEQTASENQDEGLEPYNPEAEEGEASLVDEMREGDPEAENENVLVEEDQVLEEKVFIAAGDVLYGEVISTVHSDMPLPVIVEVTTGEYRGARLRGTFGADANSGKLMVTFSQMTNVNKTVPVSALAIDGYSGDSTVRSKIERRYLKRYGSIFAATFIEGLAEGLSEPETTVLTDSNGNNQIVEEKRTDAEAAWKGVTDSVAAISGDITSSAPKGPKIYLHSGYPVGILFVDDLREDPVESEVTP